MKELDELILELFELVELGNVVLGIPICCLPIQRYPKLGYL